MNPCGACGENVDPNGIDKYGSDHCGANGGTHYPEEEY